MNLRKTSHRMILASVGLAYLISILYILYRQSDDPGFLGRVESLWIVIPMSLIAIGVLPLLFFLLKRITGKEAILVFSWSFLIFVASIMVGPFVLELAGVILAGPL